MKILTQREREVARLLGQGMRPTQIARELHVSHSTVKTHIAHVRDKAGADSTLQLAVMVARSGGQNGE